MNNRDRMRASNRHALKHMLKKGADEIWFKAHTRFKDKVYCQHFNYSITDLWNLFDGICIFQGKPVFFQVKTDAWASEKKIKEFLKGKTFTVWVFNVKLKDSKWIVLERIYS